MQIFFLPKLEKKKQIIEKFLKMLLVMSAMKNFTSSKLLNIS